VGLTFSEGLRVKTHKSEDHLEENKEEKTIIIEVLLILVTLKQ
jgi:hypothetical protein